MYKFCLSAPDTYEELQAKITEEGFVLFDGFEVPKEVQEQCFQVLNYIPTNPKEPNSQEIPEIPKIYYDMLTASLVSKFPAMKDMTKIIWDSKIMYDGYKLNMHREYVYVDTTQQISEITPFFFITWLTPFPYDGREFVYGKLNNVADQGPLVCDGISMEGLDFDHPAVTTLGKLQPKTGMCCFVDRIDPKWWHAVSRMTAGGPVVLIGAYILK